MAQGIFIIAEQQDGVFRKVTYEAVSEGRRLADSLGTTVTAAVLGADVAAIAGELGKYGADKVIVAEDAALAEYTTDAYTDVLDNLIKAESPQIIITGATISGKDLTARLAARLDAGLAMDCVGIEVADGEFTFSRPMFGGKVMATATIATTPKIAAVRPNVMAITESQKEGAVEKADVTVGEVRAQVVENRIEGGDKIELTEADIIVSGGRGTGGDYAAIEALAKLLNAAVGASRSAVDEGWRPMSDQVGQTGKVVAPNLYIACGISGAIQHLAGMSTSKYIVAINKDPEAPIFNRADFGIVGDIAELVPAITKAVQEIQ
jgi:electron transfer flavoprotein alpha subunit